MGIFEFVKEMDSYPNVSTAYRILFTMPATRKLGPALTMHPSAAMEKRSKGWTLD
uniref:Uncharacterized protein n=1 Tax=Oryza sativa subsp. japonica TaxID=39947 RepID=Q6Z143_ORYSJ|nr:unknown protein [Oryza sativa Japonica Group]BAD31407.1 unknown protein [Oryza sativa Japonica Group]